MENLIIGMIPPEDIGKINAMALPRKKIILRIQHLTDNIVKHFIKRLLIVDEENYSHWEKEIETWLTFIQDPVLVGTKNDRLPAKVVYDELLGASALRDNDWVKVCRRIRADYIIGSKNPRTTIFWRDIPKCRVKIFVKAILEAYSELYTVGNFESLSKMPEYLAVLTLAQNRRYKITNIQF